jgi:hypothetical protein
MKPAPAFITAADLHEATGRSLSKSSAYRRARELGAVRFGRRLLVPITAVRREYGDEFADSVQQVARSRMEGGGLSESRSNGLTAERLATGDQR